jgi:hypothetical protein
MDELVNAFNDLSEAFGGRPFTCLDGTATNPALLTGFKPYQAKARSTQAGINAQHEQTLSA